MNRKVKPPKNDLTGQRFGFLEVLRMEQTEKSKNSVYRAICFCHNCGKEHETASAALTRGRTKSCGCDKSRYTKLTGKNSSQFTGYEDIGGKLWWTIKYRAKNRKLKFDLDIKDVWELFVKQDKKCSLSRVPIKFGHGRNSNTTASLDRIDSHEGYTIENVQWVHKTVNIMKSTLGQDFFISMCRRIATCPCELQTEDILAQNIFAGKGI